MLEDMVAKHPKIWLSIMAIVLIGMLLWIFTLPSTDYVKARWPQYKRISDRRTERFVVKDSYGNILLITPTFTDHVDIDTLFPGK